MVKANLEPQTALNPESLLRPGSVLRALDESKHKRGVYGWWFDESLPTVPRDGALSMNGWTLLYFGTAPEKESSRTLKDRLWKNHIMGGVRNSTLRYSVASILDETFQFKVNRDSKNKPSMVKQEEDRLSRWLSEHARVSVFGCIEPWVAKDDILRNGPLFPLNIQKTTHPFRSELKQLRKMLGSRQLSI